MSTSHIVLFVLVILVAFLLAAFSALAYFRRVAIQEQKEAERKFKIEHGQPVPPEGPEKKKGAPWFTPKNIAIAAALVGGLIAIRIWGATAIAFLGGMFVGTIWSWLAPALIVLVAAYLIGWFGGYSRPRKTAGALIIVCLALAALGLHYDQPLSKGGGAGLWTTPPVCDHSSPDKVSLCYLNGSWAKIGADRPYAADAVHFCYVHLASAQIEWRVAGPNLFEYRSADGKPTPLWYKTEPGPDQGKCPSRVQNL